MDSKGKWTGGWCSLTSFISLAASGAAFPGLPTRRINAGGVCGVRGVLSPYAKIKIDVFALSVSDLWTGGCAKPRT